MCSVGREERERYVEGGGMGERWNRGEHSRRDRGLIDLKRD